MKRKVCDVKFAKCTYILHIYIYIKVLFNEMNWFDKMLSRMYLPN